MIKTSNILNLNIEKPPQTSSSKGLWILQSVSSMHVNIQNKRHQQHNCRDNN